MKWRGELTGEKQKKIRNCEGTNKKRCWISIQQRFRFGHFVPHVSSFSTCKFRVAGASELRED
jgi:hypothetical protein